MLTTEKKKYTAQDYLMLEEGAPFQLVNYDLIMSPSANAFHQRLSFKLSLIIAAYFTEKNSTGEWLFAPMDVKFDEGNIFQPDILFIVEERRAELVKNIVEGAPDLVIEILSPSNAYYDLRQKKDIYEKYGVKEYIIVDPIDESVEIHSLENGKYTLKQKATKSEQLTSILLPELSFDLTKLFS